MTYFAIGGEDYRQDDVSPARHDRSQRRRHRRQGRLWLAQLSQQRAAGRADRRQRRRRRSTTWTGCCARSTSTAPTPSPASSSSRTTCWRATAHGRASTWASGTAAPVSCGQTARSWPGSIPFQQAAWDYNTALAREAIERGFDEVQFDYIRFATDPSPDSSVDDISYSQPLTEENRVSALKRLPAARARGGERRGRVPGHGHLRLHDVVGQRRRDRPGPGDPGRQHRLLQPDGLPVDVQCRAARRDPVSRTWSIDRTTWSTRA